MRSQNGNGFGIFHQSRLLIKSVLACLVDGIHKPLYSFDPIKNRFPFLGISLPDRPERIAFEIFANLLGDHFEEFEFEQLALHLSPRSATRAPTSRKPDALRRSQPPQ
jgi:hypothetical protein